MAIDRHQICEVIVFEIRLITPAHGEVLSGGWELLDAWRQQPETVVWVDIDGALSASDQGQLEARFGLHPLALQDAARDRHPPKFEAFNDHSFLLFKGLSAASQGSDCGTIQLAVFAGERFLVTRHSGESPSVQRLARELQPGDPRWSRSAGAMAVRLSRLIVERYLNVLLALEPRLEELEGTLLTTGDDAVLAELIGYKTDLTRLRRFLHYHVDVIRDLQNGENPGFDTDLQHEIKDVFEQQERAASLGDLYYQQAADLIDGYISVSSHRLNQIMRILTIITAVFVPLSFLAGIYGMNFENMPELHSRWGYFTLLGVMGLVAATLLLTFRHKKWL